MSERKRSRRAKIIKTAVDKLPPDSFLWDNQIVGFHVRRQKGDARVYYQFYRTRDGRQRFTKIGRHGSPWTAEMAREEALRILVKVKDGGDPAGEKYEARNSPIVAELVDDYLAAA